MSWKGSFIFTEEDQDSGVLGLRKPQLGALHAIASHWSVKTDPGTVVMPTGTGKTEVMISTMVSELCDKILIIVPTSPLREQIFKKFLSLGCLPAIKVVPNNSFYPHVAFIKGGIRNINEMRETLEKSNILIGTASVLNQFDKICLTELANKCTHLFIDEAHHTPAKTWVELKTLFNNNKILQFTATPFRNDGKRIEGRIIYDYPLGLAQENGYFKRINLIKIKEANDHIADSEIAKKAVDTLEADMANNLDHVIMARTNSIKAAESLLSVYQSCGNKFNPVVIHNEKKSNEKKKIYDDLHSRETRIIICVDMLGEGYDLPNLKIAAIHNVHKNLTTTLQFIGRFTRTSSKPIGDASVIVNTAEPKVDSSLEALYSENPDWNKILRQQSESAIKKEQELQDVILNFHGELSNQVSLWNLRPAFSSLIYKTECNQWSPNDISKIIPARYKFWQSINQVEKLLVFVISKEDEVKWGRYKDIKDLSFELCVSYWNSKEQRLFINCSDYQAINCDQLAKLLCGENAKVIEGPGLFHLFSNINNPMVRNLGASQVGSISFTFYFGPEVTNGLTEIDKARSNPNNIFGWGYEEGEKVTYGCSIKSGKVWSHGGGSIVDWQEWCDHVGKKVIESNEVEPEVIRGFLRPEPLKGRHNAVAIGIEWGDRILQTPESRAYIYFNDDENHIFDVGIEIFDHNSTGPICFALFNDIERSEYEINFVNGQSGDCEYKQISGKEVFVKRYSGEKIKFLDYLSSDHFIFRYADGSFSYGKYIVQSKDPRTFYNSANLNDINWNGVDIKNESEGKERDSNSIQYFVIESIKDDYDIVINDDGSYEAADIIALKKDDEESYTLHLIHCKYSKTDNPGADISNMYELCGQAQKSICWKHSGFDVLVDHIKSREQKWNAQNYTRFIKGEMSDLLRLKKFSRYAKIDFKISLYQPGLSKAVVGTDITQLLASTENYLLKTSQAEFQVFCSD